MSFVVSLQHAKYVVNCLSLLVIKLNHSFCSLYLLFSLIIVSNWELIWLKWDGRVIDSTRKAVSAHSQYRSCWMSRRAKLSAVSALWALEKSSIMANLWPSHTWRRFWRMHDKISRWLRMAVKLSWHLKAFNFSKAVVKLIIIFQQIATSTCYVLGMCVSAGWQQSLSHNSSWHQAGAIGINLGVNTQCHRGWHCTFN